MEDLTSKKLFTIISIIKSSEKYKNNTINKFIEMIKMISKFSFYNEITNKDELFKFEKLKNDDEETRTIEKKSMQKIIEYIEKLDKKNNCNLRNIIFIYLLKETGARYNEIMHIKKENIFFDKNTILLTETKTNKPRYVYLNNYTSNLIKQYIKQANIKDYIMINFKTYKIALKPQMYKFIDDMKKQLNISESISPHKFRHTLATELLRNNLPIDQVKRLLGHTNLSTTQKYLHLNNEDDKNQIINLLNKI